MINERQKKKLGIVLEQTYTPGSAQLCLTHMHPQSLPLQIQVHLISLKSFSKLGDIVLVHSVRLTALLVCFLAPALSWRLKRRPNFVASSSFTYTHSLLFSKNMLRVLLLFNYSMQLGNKKPN